MWLQKVTPVWTVWKVLTCPENHSSLQGASYIVREHKTGWQRRGWPSPWWQNCPSISSGSLPSDRCDKSTGTPPVHQKDKSQEHGFDYVSEWVECFEHFRLSSLNFMHHNSHLLKDECCLYTEIFWKRFMTLEITKTSLLNVFNIITPLVSIWLFFFLYSHRIHVYAQYSATC